MKSKWKNLIRGVIALVVVIAIIVSAKNILILKSEDGISQMQSLYKQKKDSIDVLFLGSSRIFCNVRPGLLWDEYGIASYDLGGAETPAWSSYYQLKEAFKTQHPKVVVYEISVATIRPTLYPPIFWVQDNVYGMKWGINRIEAMKMQVYEENFKKGLSSLSGMHDRYKELTKNDFVDMNNSIDYKGFDEREGVTPFDVPEVDKITDRIPISEQAEEYTRKIVDLCEEEGVPIMFIVAPFAPSDEEQAMLNYTFDIAEEKGLDYIDFNSCYTEFGMDYSTDMADEFHMNSSGTTKFTTYLGKCLMERYNLLDHRGDENYSSWEKAATVQRQQTKEVELNAEEDLGKYFLKLINDQYLVFVSLGYGAEQSATIYDNRVVLGRLGLKQEYAITDGVFILSNGEAIYGSVEYNQRANIKQDDINLLLMREPSGEGEKPTTTLYVDRSDYDLSTDGIKIIVFDKALGKVVSEKEIPL